MHFVEKIAITIRHSKWLNNALPIWNVARPGYVRVLKFWGRHGLPRNMNGTDLIRVLPELYGLPESYEPVVWRALMNEVRVGDVVVDVGASVGLYAIAIGRRVGPHGRVFAFEPEPESLRQLKSHVTLNGLDGRVEALGYVVGAQSGRAMFFPGSLESHVTTQQEPGAIQIDAVTLTEMLRETHIDVMKIDVEGYEYHVLYGATGLLQNARLSPRAIFIEAHPFAWAKFGVTDKQIFDLLESVGYTVVDLAGNEVSAIQSYGEIIARRTSKGQS